MGDRNQLFFVEKNLHRFEGPFLEIGSRNYGSGQNLKGLLSDRGDYYGVDKIAGEGVDFVVDLTWDFETIDKILGGRRFGTILCLSVLEHCEQPFKMAENITHLLKPGGKVVISVPFAWKFHEYPADYWRFTHEGVKKLFPELVFNTEVEATSAETAEAEFRAVSRDVGKIPISSGTYWREGRWLQGLSAGVFKNIARLGPLRWVFGYSYLLRPTNIYMIGELKRS